MLKPLTVWITTNWKILKETGIPDTLHASWDICMQVKKQQLELDMEKWTSSKSGKEYIKTVYCHPAYLTYMQSTWCEMPDWIQIFVTPWTAAHEASQFFPISQNLLKLMSMDSVMPSNHLVLCHPILLLPVTQFRQNPFWTDLSLGGTQREPRWVCWQCLGLRQEGWALLPAWSHSWWPFPSPSTHCYCHPTIPAQGLPWGVSG